MMAKTGLCNVTTGAKLEEGIPSGPASPADCLSIKPGHVTVLCSGQVKEMQ
jgi:hypothetical protein